MTSNKLASARSIFEQNIAKNKQSGCDKNIFGQKAKPPCSRNVSRRLFASTKLSDSSSSSNGNEASLSSLNDSSNDHNSSLALRRSSSSSQRGQHSSSRALGDVQEQDKGQKTMEYPRSTLSNNHNSSTNYPPPTAISSGTSDLDEKLQPTKAKIRIHDAFSLKQAEKKRGSISSLAEHLTKLELKSLKPRGDNASQASQSSLGSHRDQIKLPDFRQSSYAAGTSSSHSRNKIPSTTRTRHSPEPAGNDGNQNSISSIGSDNRQRSKATRKDGSLSSLSSRQDSSMSSLDDSSQRHPPKVSPNSSRTSRDRMHDSTGSQRPSGMSKSLARHLSSSSSGNNNSPTGWIQPSAIVDDDDSCSSHHHQQPFRAVPFTKSVIKRHRESLKPVSGGTRDSSTSRLSIMDSGRNSLTSRTSSPGRRLPPRRRSSMSNTSKRRLKEKTAPPPLLDPEEVALREELETLQTQIQASEQKLVQVQEGEQYDLKRVQEVKDRKLQRIDAETEETLSASTSSRLPLTQQQEDALKKEYLQTKLAIRQLKQDNARLHDQNRKMKLEVRATRSSNALLEESNAETRVFVAELETHQQDVLLPEHNYWMQIATTYQKALLDVEEALERQEPHREKVKSDRMRFEDRIDMVVDFMQKNCKDYDLVEELTVMAFDENDDGWEEGDGESSDDDDDDSRTSFIVSYTASDSDDESRRSISDVLVGTSSHSLHLFL